MAGGRPSAISKALINTISGYVEAGAYPETAGCACGVPVKTLQAWLTRGAKECLRLDENSRFKIRDTEALYVDLRDKVTKALSRGEIRDLEVIRNAANKGVWQASAWRLERRWPERYARKIVIEKEGEVEGAAPATWRQLMMAARKAELADVREKNAATKGQPKARNIG